MTESNPVNKTENQGAYNLDPALLAACIHCGLCLPACPTYLATGRETESPRGRIHLLSLLQKGELADEPRLVEHIDSCLGCLGCQTACPSGVQYGRILDQARPILAAKRNRRQRKLMRFAFAKILPDYGRLRVFGKLLRLFQQTGLKNALTVMPLGKKWSRRLTQWQEFLPAVPKFKPLARQSWMSGEKKGEVQLFAGCVMDIFYNHVNHACIRLLTAQRQIVKVHEQTCCGALAFHAGETDIAIAQAKKNIEMFEATAGRIVVTAAGCGAMLKGYEALLSEDSEDKDTSWKERAADFCARVADIAEFLADNKFAGPSRPIKKTVTYHAACHLAHAQNIHDAPGKLLSQVEGLKVVPLREAEHCCGSAGIYNLLNTDLSLEVLARKMDYLEKTGAEVVVSTNPGCLLQLETGIKDRNLNMKAVHIAELLDEAFGQEKPV